MPRRPSRILAALGATTLVIGLEADRPPAPPHAVPLPERSVSAPLVPAPLEATESERWRTLSRAEGLLLLGHPAEARALVAELPKSGLHAPLAARLEAWSLFAEKRWSGLARSLDAAPSTTAETELLRAAAALGLGKRHEALESLRAIWWRRPESDFALAALRLLASESLANASGLTSAERRLLRARLPELTPSGSFARKGDDDAVLAELASAAPRGGELAAEIDFVRGARLLASEHFSGAAELFERSLGRVRPKALRQVIELRLGQAERRRGDYGAARRHFDAVASSDDATLAAEARALSGQMAVEHRRYPEARALFEAQLLANPVGKARSEALYGLGWVAYRTGDFLGARRFFATLTREAPFGPLAPGAVYWAGRSAAELGHAGVAASELEAVCARFPHDYYCYRAERWRQANALELTVGAARLPAAARPEHLERALSFERSGMRRRARHELDVLSRDAAWLDPDSLETATKLARKLDVAALAAQLDDARRNRFGVGGEARSVAAALFPAAFEPLVARAAESERLPDDLLLAVISRESAFNPRAVSDRGAFGLMQLTPAIALGLVREKHHRATVSRERLFEPNLNLELGARYLGRTLRAFAGRESYALAAYHAGPGAVTRWREARGDLPEEIFVEEIPYPDTRDYVRDVLARLETLRLARGAGATKLAHLETSAARRPLP